MWNLNLINTLTNEPKIAKKAGQLMRLLVAVLRKEFNKELLVHIPQHRYQIIRRKENGTLRVSQNSKLPAKRRNSISPENRTIKEGLPKTL